MVWLKELCKAICATSIADTEGGTTTVVFVAFSNEEALKALCFWAKDMMRCSLSPRLADFNKDDVPTYLDAMRREASKKELLEKDTPKPPKKLMDVTKYCTWARELVTYLARLRGVDGTHLSYVVCQNQNPIHAGAADDLEALIKSAPLHGPSFVVDNKRIHEILKSLILKGPAYAWMLQYDRDRDGRSAYLALDSHFMAHFMGDVQRNSLKQATYESIERATFNGGRNSNFHNYLNIHQEAHNDLALYSKPVPEAKKVCDFLSGIKATHHDVIAQ